MRIILLLTTAFLMMTFGSSHKEADLLIFNAEIYTLDADFSIAESMVIKDGKVLETGTLAEIKEKYKAKEETDAGGKFIYPGFIDAHSHFVGYGLSLQQVDLMGAESWEEVLERCQTFAKNLKKGEWLTGRGWDQNRWPIKEFPTNEDLDRLFPDRPVYLTRVDGHAAVASSKALELAGVEPGRTIDGGTFEMKNGKLTGILVDNAMGAVRSAIPKPDKEFYAKALKQAQENCFAVGLTSLAEAGLGYDVVELVKELQDEGKIKMRIYAMLSANDENINWLKKTGTLKTEYMNVRSFKMFGDGALGSRGACLLEDYSDQPGWKGFLLSSPEHFDSIAGVLYENNWQLNTHAIGDSTNRAILQTYARHLKGENDLRWRIEHSQIIHPDDFSLFGDYSIIPSVQPTHATSDMYWAGDRLGSDRLKGAYAYLDLMKENSWIPLGTDFPVEDISPFKTFYAAVVREDTKGYPVGGFQPENALSREDALRGMTIWAAKSQFEENEKGSLENGKWADFIILDKDLMTAPENELLGIKVISTYSGGQIVYKKS